MYKVKKIERKNKTKLILISNDMVLVNASELKKRIARYLSASSTDNDDKLSQKLQKLNKKLKSFNWFEIRNAYMAVQDAIMKEEIITNQHNSKEIAIQPNLKIEHVYESYECEQFLNRTISKYHKKVGLKSILGLPIATVKIEQYTPQENSNETTYCEKENTISSSHHKNIDIEREK